jgi:hypothetical protein
MTRNAESNGIIPTQWNIITNPIPQGLSINSTSGLLSFSSLYNINQTVNIMASNVLGGCNIVPFTLNLTPLPYLSNVSIDSNSTSLSSNSVILNWNGNYVSNVDIYANIINNSNSSNSNILYSSISNIFSYLRLPHPK